MKKGMVAAASVDEYIKNQPPAIQKTLRTIRKTIRDAAPDAEEKISYGMPGYKLNGMLVFFAAFKNHYSFFTGSKKSLSHFKEKLSGYELLEAGFKISLTEPVPEKLITEITKYRVKENKEKASLKNAK
jgi:uncharacterized protein YdhG (YjbR/CyaY superfamily)